MIKKIFNIFICLLLITTSFFSYYKKVSAITVRDLMSDLDKKEKELKANSNKQKLNESEMKKAEQDIASISTNLNKIQDEYIEIAESIKELNDKIKEKEKETKELIAYFQIANGENVYMEYAFGATSITDFIYKAAVVDQLTDYNNNLMNEMNNLIVENNKKNKDLHAKEESLTDLRKTLGTKLYSLGVEKQVLSESYSDIEDDVKQLRENVNNYKSLCNNLDQDINTCGQSGLVNNASFKRPLDSGRISSDFGYRVMGTSGEYHYGIDIAASLGTNVYAAASGIVTAVAYDSSRGNNVWVIHKVNNQLYTTGYFHLSYIHVKVGQEVSSNTVIGRVGSTGRSTGAHLHFELSKGARFVLSPMYGIASKDAYTSYQVHLTRIVSPRQVLSFPQVGGTYSSR